ncbi:MAG: M48 family metallopeptidase [Nitrospinae bacterium]|nr:M48 family metallopeptidase [Nitrospinota bacterium]
MSLTGLLVALGGIIVYAEGGDPLLGVGVAFIVASVMGAFSWFAGASIILAMSGAKKVTHESDPQLFNVVEEMKIASGLPMPDVYIIEEDAPNAFATGRDQDHSAVAVTRGLLNKLNRDELQGVIAHEFSHIRNLDIRYAMLVGVLVGATALIADAFLRGFGRGGKRGSNPALLALALVFAILAPISAKILQMAISRSREFMADASAVELTRNPDGLASALAKITQDPAPLAAANRATQHLYIVNPVKSFNMDSKALFSTHPPTEARINKLVAMGATGKYTA